MTRPGNTNRTASNFIKWFNPRGLRSGSIAFIINRVAGLGLTFYLFLHLFALSQLAQGPQAYDGFIAMVKSPIFTAGELVVVAGVLLHGFNGIRVGLTSLGIGSRSQKKFLYGLMGIALVGCAYFAVRMFGGA